MKNKLVSIVLPIYNVEKYIKYCLETVINQTYKNIEIILVDDGSTDMSGTICDEYERKDSRIKVIHKENGGLSDARNAGLKIANGEYITFVDSDDCIAYNFIEILVTMMEKNNAEISICNYKSVEEDFSLKEKNLEDNINKVHTFNNIECIKEMYFAKIKGLEFVAWGKMYLKKLFLNNEIIYPKGKIHEDTYTTYKLIYNAKKIVFNEMKLYYYRQRNGSIMNTKFNIKYLDKLEAILETCAFFDKNSQVDLLQLAFNDYLKNSIKLYYKLHVHYNDIEKEKIKREIIKNSKSVYDYYIKKIKYPIAKRIYYNVIFIIPDRIKCLIIKKMR